MRNQVNSVFSGIFKIADESAATLTAYVLSDTDAVIATKTVNKREGGYLFSHVFVDVGIHTIKVVDSNTVAHYATVDVYAEIAAQVWDEVL